MVNKNILLVVPRLNIGGAETYVMTLAIALKKKGADVHVASGGGKLAEVLQSYGIRHHFVPIRLNATLAAKVLVGIVNQYHIDLIHANSAAAGIAAIKAKESMAIPVVYTAHGVFGHNEKEMTLAKCDKIICVSDYVKRDAVKKGFHEARLQTIYTGIDSVKFKPNKMAGKKLRESLSIPQAAFTLAITARIKNLHNKGHEDILRVLREYEGAKNWHLLVIGKGKSFWQLKWLIWRWGLQGRVHCLGHRLNVEALLNAADAVVLPSKFETFGLVLAEGMAMEKAAVAYAVGGTPEVIADGQTGYLAKAGNVDDLYEKLSILAGDAALCSVLGRQGRQLVMEKFSCEQMVEAILKVYDEICSITRGIDDEK